MPPVRRRSPSSSARTRMRRRIIMCKREKQMLVLRMQRLSRTPRMFFTTLTFIPRSEAQKARGRSNPAEFA
eukprot:8575683-Lingulodinium_polyedra.AAC.1